MPALSEFWMSVPKSEECTKMEASIPKTIIPNSPWCKGKDLAPVELEEMPISEKKKHLEGLEFRIYKIPSKLFKK